MAAKYNKGMPFVVLFSQDERLAQTRQWLLEQARFHVATVYRVADLDAISSASEVSLFLLCNTLSAELITEAVALIRGRWPTAKMLLFAPTEPFPDWPVDETFSSIDGPAELIETVRKLVRNDQPLMN